MPIAPWPLDVPIGDLASAGLPAPSIVRFKLFTLDQRLVRRTLRRLGTLGAEDREWHAGSLYESMP